MFEIELKAWCDDRKATEEKLKKIASFIKHAEKNDEYWSAIINGKTVKLRIREERQFNAKTGESLINYAATYKNKEVKKHSAKAGYEVNDEKEFTIDKPEDLRFFLQDIGFSVTDIKKKSTDYWCYKINKSKNATIEISEVFELGTFIEIEILETNDDSQTVQKAKDQLIKLLKLCGISEDKIETRYYTEMLNEKKSVR
jgi:adenylate cyclase class 2